MGPFIIYGREGAGDFGEGATYFWQVAERGGHLFLASRGEGGPLIFGAKKFEKARETHFSTHFSTRFWGGGHLFLASR